MKIDARITSNENIFEKMQLLFLKKNFGLIWFKFRNLKCLRVVSGSEFPRILEFGVFKIL